MDKNKYNMQQNSKVKAILKKVGFTMLSIGIFCILIGFIDFASSFGSSAPPRLFFLLLIGIPLLGGGSMMLSYAYMGKIARYQAREIAPIAKDTTNYMLNGTKEEVSEVISSIIHETKKNKKVCPICQTENDFDSIFCDKCGTKMSKECYSCGGVNDADATYCKKCGQKLSK